MGQRIKDLIRRIIDVIDVMLPPLPSPKAQKVIKGISYGFSISALIMSVIALLLTK